jgi:hypothetical protein
LFHEGRLTNSDALFLLIIQTPLSGRDVNMGKKENRKQPLVLPSPGSASGKIANLKLKNRFLDMCPGIFPGKSVRTCPGNSVRLWLANGGKIGILAL